jgi:hypothetical protein
MEFKTTRIATKGVQVSVANVHVCAASRFGSTKTGGKGHIITGEKTIKPKRTIKTEKET